ncbi:hypothetical protein PV721_17190, partial [Streptomyces sp. MB09-01]|uniref:hypothetical protein n=1 Tax=Streptomyces sp. MB09-01 TaxID=3028666 RepID=UPI0029B12B90
ELYKSQVLGDQRLWHHQGEAPGRGVFQGFGLSGGFALVMPAPLVPENWEALQWPAPVREEPA